MKLNANNTKMVGVLEVATATLFMKNTYLVH